MHNPSGDGLRCPLARRPDPQSRVDAIGVGDLDHDADARQLGAAHVPVEHAAAQPQLLPQRVDGAAALHENPKSSSCLAKVLPYSSLSSHAFTPGSDSTCRTMRHHTVANELAVSTGNWSHCVAV